MQRLRSSVRRLAVRALLVCAVVCLAGAITFPARAVAQDPPRDEGTYIFDIHDGTFLPLGRPAATPLGVGLMLSWSRDGGRVAIADPVSGGLPRLLSDPTRYAISPLLSADGRSVVLVENHDTGADLILMATDGSDRRVLVRDAPGLFLSSWSPDGNRIGLSMLDRPVTDCIRGLP